MKGTILIVLGLAIAVPVAFYFVGVAAQQSFGQFLASMFHAPVHVSLPQMPIHFP